LDVKLLHLIATAIDACDQPPSHGPGHPASETVRVIATLRRFLRDGTPWRSLRASADQASGSTLRRCLRRWAETGLLAKVHALLAAMLRAAMLRGHSDLILDTCTVRAKRGGDLTGPNPTDRGKRGTKYHIATDRDGVPLACIATAANVNDTLVFERLFLAALLWRVSTPCSRTRGTTPNATASCAAPSEPSPPSTSVANHVDQGWESNAGRSSAAMPGYSRTNASPCAMTGSASSFSPCFRPPAYSWSQAASPANSENRL
jgi:hypothetical protein